MLSPESFGLLLEGLRTTVWLALLSMGLSLLLGTLIGVLRVAPAGVLNTLAEGYVQFFRNIPLLIILFFVLNGLPEAGIRLPFFYVGVVGLTTYTAAYVAEAVRAGLASLQAGQMEAARSLGFSWTQAMRLILLPQAFRNIMPPLGNLFIALVKNTSLASAVGVGEILYQAEVIEGRTFNPNIFVIAGLIYLVLTIPLGFVVNQLERALALPSARR